MSKDNIDICVIGLGYIGLPTASLLGTKGYKVFGVDKSEVAVNTINKGRIHIVEPDLDILVKSAVHSGNLLAGKEARPADIFIIAVPTPLDNNKDPDMSYVKAAVEMITPHIRRGNLVILESTSPVGTTDEILVDILAGSGYEIGTDVFVAYCPERVLPGRILKELVENDRIVGGINEKSAKIAAEFYKKFVLGEVLCTDSRTAEMAKLTENSYRDVNIAFANELSFICDSENINIWELIKLANRHPRVDILQPGPGVGGHCIAVDPWFIVSRNSKHSNLIRTARDVNDKKPGWVVNKVKKCAEKLKDPVIGCLGMSFKANVDDLRESPALDVIHRLVEGKVGKVLVCEPNLTEHHTYELMSLDHVVTHSDIVLLLVNHNEFLSLNHLDLREKIVIDTRGVIA